MPKPTTGKTHETGAGQNSIAAHMPSTKGTTAATASHGTDTALPQARHGTERAGPTMDLVRYDMATFPQCGQRSSGLMAFASIVSSVKPNTGVKPRPEAA